MCFFVACTECLYTPLLDFRYGLLLEHCVGTLILDVLLDKAVKRR